ncbi:hypothetical protein ES703_34950 [subsurface metagenome]
MERAVRYRDQKHALQIGHLLGDHFTTEVMTGLNFFIEPDQSVIVIACFTNTDHQPDPKAVDSLMLPGQVIDQSLSELIYAMPDHTMMMIGDGLRLFEIYYRARHGLDARDPLIP